jgi:hypothetical protein
MSNHRKCVDAALLAWMASTSSNSKSRLECLIRELDAYKASSDAGADRGENFTKSVWLEVFNTYSTVEHGVRVQFYLLSGLLKNERWRTLFEQIDTAHAFVSLAIGYIENNASGIGQQGYLVRSKFAAGLSEWLVPGEGVEGTSIREIAAALFGEPWCVLVYDASSPGTSLAALIGATRPEFLPDRLTAGAVQHASPLPDISC